MNAFVIHGTYGNPQENWFPWLKAELEKICYSVFVPKFPTPENQNLDNWLVVFEKYKQHLDKETIFVGHSLGSAFILNLLERIEVPVKACFFVSGFVGNLNNPKFDELNDSIANKEFNWKKIKKNCNHFFVFHSDNDLYVPGEKAVELAKYLGIKPIIVKGAGHFNADSGYTTFPLLLKQIKKFSSQAERNLPALAGR